MSWSIVICTNCEEPVEWCHCEPIRADEPEPLRLAELGAVIEGGETFQRWLESVEGDSGSGEGPDDG